MKAVQIERHTREGERRESELLKITARKKTVEREALGAKRKNEGNETQQEEEKEKDLRVTTAEYPADIRLDGRTNKESLEWVLLTSSSFVEFYLESVKHPSIRT